MAKTSAIIRKRECIVLWKQWALQRNWFCKPMLL